MNLATCIPINVLYVARWTILDSIPCSCYFYYIIISMWHTCMFKKKILKIMMHVQFLIILIHHSTQGNASSNTQLNHNSSVLMTTQFLHFHLGLFLHFRIVFRKKHSFTLQKDNLSCTHTFILQTRKKIIVVSLIYLKWYFLYMYRTRNHSWSELEAPKWNTDKF